MSEKLLLKTTLNDELNRTNSEIIKLFEKRNDKFADLKVIDAKLMVLNEHKKFVEHVIEICVQRNKF